MENRGDVTCTHLRDISRLFAAGLAFLLVGSAASARGADLEEDFKRPPEETKPYCYWYWVNKGPTKDGITKDLETMAKVGIKRAMIGNIYGSKKVKMFSPEWYALTRHAFKEANRLSVELNMFNGPGWSQSGGPWIKPEQSMRRVVWNEVAAKGGPFSAKVRPDEMVVWAKVGKRKYAPKTMVRPAGQDIAVLAVPKLDHVSIVGSAKSGGLFFEHSKPFTARALVVEGKHVDAELYAIRDGRRTLVARVNAAFGSARTSFLPYGIETFSFKGVTARRFELVPRKGAYVGDRVVLTSEPKVAQVIEKQMGRMHPTPHPSWESYIFPDTVEPDDPSIVVKRKNIINLTDKLSADGTLKCTLPKGDWTIIHFGMVTTGKKNHPAPREGTGLECDKMSRAHTEHHFNSMFGKLLSDMTPAEKAAFKGITIDSYEVGAQNWTDGFAAEFEKRNGYNPMLG